MRPASIEARGYKDGKQVMVAKRETTGAAAKLVMTADRAKSPPMEKTWPCLP